MRKIAPKSIRFWRIVIQSAFFVLFLVLFRLTDYNGTDQIPYAVNLFFRLDPLLALLVMLAEKTLIFMLFPAVIVLVLTFFFGRFFCQWICPMGTILDLLHRIIPPNPKLNIRNYTKIKYILLIVMIGSAAISLSYAGLFDPLSILVRTMTITIDPALRQVVTAPFDLIYQSAPPWISDFTEPVYAALKSRLIPYRQSHFTLSFFSAFIFLLIIAAEKIQRRFWCRNLCPLGALLALVSKFSLLRGFSEGECSNCNICRQLCRTNAIDEKYNIDPQSCILCFDCQDKCPDNQFVFRFQKPGFTPLTEGLSRREFISSAATGLLIPTFLRIRPDPGTLNSYLIRPPGALNEPEFVNRCVRCGECMKVCIGNALHPTFLQAGIEGMFSPILISRIGYCEFECTLCGQVCPTGAIRQLSKSEKQKTIIGKAVIDKNRCLPFAKGISCIVCEEHCPTPDKAIKFKTTSILNDKMQTVQVKQPYVIDTLCIGCGICETKCPVDGQSAVQIFNEDESRRKSESNLFVL